MNADPINSESTNQIESKLDNPNLNSESTRKRKRWQPTGFNQQQPPKAPKVDYKMQEELAAQAIAQAAGLETRRSRKFLQRRTVDYSGALTRWNQARASPISNRQDRYLRPSINQVVSLLPPAAYSNSVTSVGSSLVHTSTNKIRCAVDEVLWMPDGRRLLTGSSSGEFTLWNAQTFNFETILQAHDSPIRAAQWSKSGYWLISSDQHGTIKYFQPNMNNLQAFQGSREAIRGLSFSPDDQRFVSASDDSILRIWKFDEAREESVLKGHGWDARSVDWHPTKGLIVSGGKDNLVKFWDPRSSTNLATLHGHKNTVHVTKWSPDGNLMASASRDLVTRIYDVRAMKELHVLKGHKDGITTLAFHPIHHSLLVTGSSDGALLHWSLESSTPENPIHVNEGAHEGSISSVAWHPLGHLLATGSSDFTTRFWERGRPGEESIVEDLNSGDMEKKLLNKKKAMVGTDWDNDDFIPGLSSSARPQVNNDFNPPGLSLNSGSGGFSLPGLGGGGADMGEIPGLGGGGIPGLGGASAVASNFTNGNSNPWDPSPAPTASASTIAGAGYGGPIAKSKFATGTNGTMERGVRKWGAK